MEHFYVISGNEFGVNLDSKLNFRSDEKELATISYDLLVEEENFYTALVHVLSTGEEVNVFSSMQE